MPLHVERTSKHTFIVTGGAEAHYVDASTPDCDCGAWIWKAPKECKHILAVRAYIREQKGAA